MHICVSELTIISSDNGLSRGRRQAIIWNNAGLLLIEPLGTNFSEISIRIQTFLFKKMHLNKSSAICRPFCLGLSVWNDIAYLSFTQKNSGMKMTLYGLGLFQFCKIISKNVRNNNPITRKIKMVNISHVFEWEFPSSCLLGQRFMSDNSTRDLLDQLISIFLEFT